ncbi:MAG: hypothetical protein ACYS1E_20325 [Planctomycetota bacterium]|jgi:hypothetical protein
MAKEIIEAEVKSNIGEVAKETEQLAEATKDAEKGFKGVGNTIKGMGTALKAAGIGLVVGLFAKLMDVFRQNQKVVDIFNTAMEFLSLTFNDFFKFLQSNIDTASGFMDRIFGNEVVQSMIDFGRTLSIEVITRVKNLIQGIGGLGSALVKVFKGDFAGASETAKAAITDLTEVVTGNVVETVEMEKAITKVTDKIKDYAKSTLDSAKAIVSLRKESELAQVQVQGLIEEYDRQAEKLRQVRDDETKTFEERIAANEELGRVLKEQEEEMLKLVDIQIKAAQADVDKNNSLENQIKLQEALNEKKAVEAQITGFQSEQLTNQVSLQKEQTQFAIENADAQIQAYSDLAGALSSLAGDNKALAVAQAVIDTYAGANKAFAQGGVAGFVSGAAIIAAGLTNVKKILDTDVGGGGGGGSVPTDTGTPAPQVLSGAFTLGGGEAQPVQAYVVTDDMTNNQNKLANIRRRATI